MNAAELLLGSEALRRHGARRALTCGDDSVTYEEFAARVARSAAALAASGVRPGDRVLLLMSDTVESAAAWLGAVRLGAVAVALNNRLSAADLRHILADSAPRLALVETAFSSEHAAALGPLASAGRLLTTGNAWQERCAAAPATPVHAAQAGDPAFALYTSGTTGRPKGILHSHGSFRQLGGALRLIGIEPGERVLTTSKLFFAYGLEHGLLGVLAIGGESILFPGWPDADAVADLVARRRPAAVFSVPTIYRKLLSTPRDKLAPFRAVRRFVAAGERLSPQLVERWKQTTGGELLNLYGMSETFCACMVTPPGTSDGVRTGKLLDGIEVRLVDGAAEEGVSHGGVLWIRHPALPAGYLNLPEQTREQFKDGWFCTRDVFSRDDEGFYVHQGRSDELVKVAGQWVWPGELEAAVAGLPSIAEAACVPVPDADGLERLALFVTARGDAEEALRAAAEACDRALPRHKRPKWLRAVQQLPRTATGKVQRFKLREMLERGEPSGD